MNLPSRSREESSRGSTADLPVPAAPATVLENDHQAQPQAIAPRLVRSRRKRWLELNPSYFASASGDLELVDPLSYDRLIRQHQSTTEREREGKEKGWAKTLETSLLRGEAKLAAIRPDGAANGVGLAQHSAAPGTRTDWTIAPEEPASEDGTSTDKDVEKNAPGSENRNSADDTETEEPEPEDKIRGEERWRELLAERFIAGNDEDFDYAAVDSNEELDADEGVSGTWVEREREAKWFDEEDSDTSKSPPRLEGQTGVQDF